MYYDSDQDDSINWDREVVDYDYDGHPIDY